MIGRWEGLQDVVEKTRGARIVAIAARKERAIGMRPIEARLPGR